MNKKRIDLKLDRAAAELNRLDVEIYDEDTLAEVVSSLQVIASRIASALPPTRRYQAIALEDLLTQLTDAHDKEKNELIEQCTSDIRDLLQYKSDVDYDGGLAEGIIEHAETLRSEILDALKQILK